MSARDRFTRTRRHVRRLREIKLLLMYGCEDWKPEQPKARNEASDPTANRAIYNATTLQAKVDELHREEAELENYIGTTLAIIQAVRDGLGSKYADMLEGYYIDCKTYEQLSREHKLPKTSCFDAASIALDWVDSVGVGKLLNGETEV